MSKHRYSLAPQMRDYDDFVDRSETRWVPYLMYFHRKNYRSSAVNTDRFGFRISQSIEDEQRCSVEQQIHGDTGGVNLLVGSSTAFGVGATNDSHTISSKLNTLVPGSPWLNFGARGYSSTQEVFLYLLHRQYIPKARNIVIFSGLNNLVLAGLPRHMHGEYGPFFFSGEYYQQMEKLKESHRNKKKSWHKHFVTKKSNKRNHSAEPISPLERISLALENTERDLENWKLLAKESNAQLSFVTQPLATWVKNRPSQEEELLFAELDNHPSNFWGLFESILARDIGTKYVEGLKNICVKKKVHFLDMNSSLAENTDDNEWLFIDRAHFNDYGYEKVSRFIASKLQLS